MPSTGSASGQVATRPDDRAVPLEGSEVAAMLHLERRRILAQLRLRERSVLPASDGCGSNPDISPRRNTLDFAQEWAGRELESVTQAPLLARLAALERALERLRSGGYGTCEACGEGIPRRRLEAVPGATFCVSCQEAHERSTPRTEPIRNAPTVKRSRASERPVGRREVARR